MSLTLSRHDKLHSYRTKEVHRGKKPSRSAEPLNEVSDLEWFASHQNELELFRDKYVAIYNTRVLGWGESVREALVSAKALDIHSDPLVAYLEPRGLQAF